MADRYVNYDKLLEERHRLGLDEMSMIHKVNALNQFIDHLPTADVVEESKWIDVDEKLPKEKINCLVHYVHSYSKNDGFYAIGLVFYNGVSFQFDNISYRITHWMLLPEPPSGAKMDGNK